MSFLKSYSSSTTRLLVFLSISKPSLFHFGGIAKTLHRARDRSYQMKIITFSGDKQANVQDWGHALVMGDKRLQKLFEFERCVGVNNVFEEGSQDAQAI